MGKYIYGCLILLILAFSPVAGLAQTPSLPMTTQIYHVDMLSGNTAPSQLFSKRLETSAEYDWITDGCQATDRGLVASSQNLTDGIASDEHACITEQGHGEAYGNVKFDLKNVYKVSMVKLWTNSTEHSYMDYFEVYASIDDINYGMIGKKENSFIADNRYHQIALEFNAPVCARYIRILMHKSAEKETMKIGEAAIYGVMTNVTDKYIAKTVSGDNGTGNSLCTEQRISNLEYSWDRNQPFMTEFDITEVDQPGKNLLTDGDYSPLCATQYEYATAVFDLKKPYQIGSINVWSLVNPVYYMDGFEVKYSLDGETYFSYGFFQNENDRSANQVKNTVAHGIPGKNARYLKIIMHSNGCMAIGEVEINGYEIGSDEPESSVVPDRVNLRCILKNHVLAYLDWSGYNTAGNQVSRFVLYIEKKDFSNVFGKKPYAVFDKDSKAFQNRIYSCYPLEPETTYYIAVTPVDRYGVERQDVAATKITTPPVLGERPKDIFCINFYPEKSNQASHMYGSYGMKNVDNVLHLIAEIGNVQKNRWYTQDFGMISRFNKMGLGYLLMFDGNAETVKRCNNNGVWIFSSGNECDIRPDITPAQYFETVKRINSMVKGVDSRNIMSEPALTTTSSYSLEWLDELYRADGANGKIFSSLYNVFDLHSYCKIADGLLPGLDGYGYPEVLPSKLQKLREVLANYGDENKPMIFSEMGWCVNPYENYLRNIDTVKQRDYIVRAYLLSIAEGIREAYIYALQDDGVDKLNTEDNYGIIDWFGMPKPAYYGYYILSAVMQNTDYMGTVETAVHPDYGYKFWDYGKNQYMYALWAADDKEKRITLLCDSENNKKLKIIGSDGSYQVLSVTNGEAEATISGAPIFIYSDKKIEIRR